MLMESEQLTELNEENRFSMRFRFREPKLMDEP